MKHLTWLALLLAPSHGWVHPVSFQESVGVMGYHTPRVSHFQVNKSWKYWFATGYHYLSVRPKKHLKTAHFLSTNFLLKRWNGQNYQANIYIVTGIGVSDVGGMDQAVGLGLLQFDTEDRNYYFLAKYAQIQSKTSKEMGQGTIRAGFSPYVGKFTEIHSWLIMEYQRTDILGGDTNNDITPYLRVFYKNVLFEVGHSFNGQFRFNYITHF